MTKDTYIREECNARGFIKSINRVVYAPYELQNENAAVIWFDDGSDCVIDMEPYYNMVKDQSDT